jgi:hypothetical protein
MERTAEAGPEKLTFAFLVYREESARWGPTWIARSVLTGHLAEARTSEAAVDALEKTIDAAVSMALELGQTPEQWYACQPTDERRYVAEFCGLARNVVRREWSLRSAGREIEASVATAGRAA